MMQQPLDQNIANVLEDIVQNQQEKDYNLFLIGPDESGKSLILNVLEKYMKEKFNIYECNNFPKMDSQQLNHIRSILRHNYQINNSPKSLIIFVFNQLEIIIDKSKKIFDFISQISQGVKQAFIIFNYSESEQQTKRFHIKFLENYESKKQFLQEHTCQLLDHIIQQERMIFVKLQSNSQDVQIDRQIITQLFKKQNYQQVQIEYKFNDQTLNKINQTIAILSEQIQQRHQKIILEHLQDLIKFCFPEKYYQLPNTIKEDYSIKEKYYAFLKVFETLKLLQSETTQIQRNQQDNILNIIENEKDYFIKDTLYIICLKYTTQQLQQLYEEYYQRNQKFNKVFIFSLFYFAADEDIKMPGISVYIYTYYFNVLRNISFDLSGADGYTYQYKAQNGKNKNNEIDQIDQIDHIDQQDAELDGENGHDGEQGQDGGSFVLNSKKYKNFQKIQFHLRGGNGGKGQDGGDGANGSHGKDAQEFQLDKKNKKQIFKVEPVSSFPRYVVENLATFNKTLMIFLRSEGTSGQKGGNAGSGGFGGQKGEDGILWVSNSFVGKINYKNQITRNGQNGQPGQIGKGGLNGKDCEGQYQDVFVFASFRDIGKDVTEKGVYSQTVALGVSVGTKIALFAEQQGVAKLLSGALGGVFYLVGQTVFSGIQIAINDDKLNKIQLKDKGSQSNGSINKTVRLGKIQDEKQIKMKMEKTYLYFSEFVKENIKLVQNQITHINQFQELFREQ